MSEFDILRGRDITKICRTCLMGGELTPIFEKCQFPEECVAEMLTTCTLIDCSENDALPKFVCFDCLQEIHSSYSFAAKCEKSDKILRKYIAEMNKRKKETSNQKRSAKNQNQIVLGHDGNVAHVTSTKDIQQESVLSKKHCDYNQMLPEIPTEFMSTETLSVPQYLFTNDEETTSDNIFTSDCCGIEYKSVSSLNTHFEEKHNDVEYLLTNCDDEMFKYTTDTSIDSTKTNEVHEQTCQNGVMAYGSTQEIYHNGKEIYDKDIHESNQEIHKNDVEGKKHNLTCHVCYKSFSSKAGLKQHLHTHGEKKYLCNFCGKAMATTTGLSIHLRTHNNVKRYTCDICHSKFTQSATLEAHKLKHFGIKLHTCQLCGQNFSQEHPCCEALKEHLRIHTVTKSYPCHFCGRRFSTTSGRWKHEKIHKL